MLLKRRNAIRTIVAWALVPTAARGGDGAAIARPQPVRVAASQADGADLGIDALVKSLTETAGAYERPDGRRALALLAEKHATDPRVARAVGRVALYPPYGLPIPRHPSIPEYSAAYGPAMALLRAVAARNPDRVARGQAAFGLALQAKRAARFADLQDLPGAAALRAAAGRDLAAVVKDYGDFPCLAARDKGGTTLGERAKAEAFELDRLRPGERAPAIEGADLDGREFTLADYRGRVVLLVFWASWCGPCMAEVPRERALADRLKGRPFAIVGVNGDEDADAARQAMADARIHWRSFSNGPAGAYGPINAAWNVRVLPSVYVIDHAGVIRHVAIYGKELDAAVEKLVARAEADAASSPRR